MGRETPFQSDLGWMTRAAIVVAILIIGGVVYLGSLVGDSLGSAGRRVGSSIEAGQVAFRRNPVAFGVNGDSLDVVVVTCENDPVTEIGGEVVGPSGARSFRAQPVARQAIVAQDRPGQQSLPAIWRIGLEAGSGTISQVEGTLPNVASDRLVTISVVTRSSTYQQQVRPASLSEGSVLVNGTTYPAEEFIDSVAPFRGALSLGC